MTGTGSWRPEHAKQWHRVLELHVLPHLGGRPVSAIECRDALNVLSPIWLTMPATAKKVRVAIDRVVKYAVFHGLRSDNPMAAAVAALPRVRRASSRPFVPIAAVPEALAAVCGSQVRATTRLAFRFMVLTATRPGEALGARWDEIDSGAAVWTIPAERMRSRRKHRVPLSSQGLDVLAEARELHGCEGFVFPNGSNRPISRASLSALLRMLGIDGVPSGFRKSFRAWMCQRRRSA